MPATTVIAICGVVVFLGYELVLRAGDTQTATWSGDDADRGSTRLILATYVAVIAVNVAFGGASTGTVEPFWRWMGLVCMVVGLAVRAWAMTTLGRHYTRTLRTLDQQQIVDRGPYRFVRHPGYTGSILVWLGYALALGNWIATAITVALLTAVYLWRMNAEEALLQRSFGDRYADYRLRTKRLLPFVY
jgi:protein-S-isoprenylcysteine O-methyltransferase